MSNSSDNERNLSGEKTRNNIPNGFQTLIDSESEDEHEKSLSSMESNNKRKEKSSKLTMRKVSVGLNSDSDDTSNSSDNERNISGEKTGNNMPNGFQTLIDSESEEEHEKSLSSMKSNNKRKEKSSKPAMRKVSVRASKEEAMKQIHSETQRLIRETEVSLPYHRPKQRTLQEFLSRKKVMSILPKAPTMAAKLKMSSAIVEKVLKEKEKEAEIFYKSSDSEEETEILPLLEKKSSNVESTEEPKKDNVSRKLFIDDNLSTNNDEQESRGMSKTETEATENNKPITNDIIENNINEPVMLETHCETSNTENENEVTEKLVETPNDVQVDDSLQKQNVVTHKDKEENLKDNVEKSNDNETVNSKIADETLSTSTANMNDSYASIVKKSLGLTAEESDEYNEYGLPPPIFDDSPNINEKKKLLLNAKSLKPKLRGAPGIMIDLSDNIKPNKKGVNALIDRFVCKHSKTNVQIHNESDVTTIQIKETPNGLSIIKETLPYKLPKLVVEDSKLKKPGVKLMLLKEELKHKIALKRDEEWKQREQDMKEQEIEWNESINMEDNVSEPYSPSIESYISKEDELEEEDDDVYMKKEKKKSKCAFVDDEAEVSDDEMDNDEIIEDEDEDENEGENEKESESLVLEDEDESNTCDSSDTFSKHKSFKRIVRPSDDDSRSCDTENNEETINGNKTTSSLRTIISGDIFSGSTNENKGGSDAESDIPVSQTYVENDVEHEMSQTPQTKTNSFKFISPLTQLTALNTDLECEDEADKAEHYLLTDEANPFSMDSTQTEKSQKICELKIQAPQRKLFSTETNITDEDLMQLCSGKFTQSSSTLNLSKEPCVTESQLLNICSGSFNTQVTNAKELIDDSIDETSFKKCTQNEEKNSKKGKKSWTKSCIVSSDEEDLIENEINNRSRRKVRKLNVSDDEEENDLSASDKENDEDEENYENDEDDEEKYVDYDSEENEVVVPKKNIQQYAATFLEGEAELSESDCDVSADEDENDLDKLELEEGDNEDIDEVQMKNQLGKLHMRQILDEDQKEVRILKELLFEDGDLYSESGRERKFKWKNIDKQEDNDQSQPVEGKDGWVDLSDEEDETKWRKIRHEREKFLSQNTANIDTEIENDLSNSQIFKFGMKILKKRRIDDTQKQDTLLDANESNVKSRMPHTIADMLSNSNLEGKARVIHNVMQKRSFLAKGEETLARLAVLAKQRDAPPSSMNTKNFVFTHIHSPTETESTLISETETERYKGKRKR